MSQIRLQTNASEPIIVFATDLNGDPLTSLTDLKFSIRRHSDDFYLDFDDNTFKSSGWTTKDRALLEIDSVNAPGQYKPSTDFLPGFITNPSTDDHYILYFFQTPGSNAVLPPPAEFAIGKWLDDIDATISSRSTHSANDVRDATFSATPVANSIGEALQLLKGVAGHSNTVHDLIVYDAQGFMTSHRIRVYANSTDANAAIIDGALDGNEVFVINITANPDGTHLTQPNDFKGIL